MRVSECTVSVVAQRSEWFQVARDAPEWFRDRIWRRESLMPRGSTDDPAWTFDFRASSIEKATKQAEWATGQTFVEPDLIEQMRRKREEIEAIKINPPAR